jgi:hypothetical protein
LLKNDTFMRISGATQADYNGDFAITVTGSNTFTYQVANSPASPATGTITSKVAPADWTKPFSGTNVAAYKQGAGSNGFYLRVDDTTTDLPKVKAFESMTDINYGTGQFPSDAQGVRFLLKSDGTNAKEWVIVANEKLAFIMTSSGNGLYPTLFGDFISKKSGDAFNTILHSVSSVSDSSPVSSSGSISAVSASCYVARNHTQIGTSSPVGYNCIGNATYFGNTNLAYPSPIDGALHLTPIKITEPTGIRGDLPALWNPLHTKPFTHMDVIVGTGDFSGKKFLAFTGGWVNQAQWLIEISNTW